MQADLSSKELSRLTPVEAKEKADLEARLDDLQVPSTARIAQTSFPKPRHLIAALEPDLSQLCFWPISSHPLRAFQTVHDS